MLANTVSRKSGPSYKAKSAQINASDPAKTVTYFSIAPDEALVGYLMRMALAGRTLSIKDALDICTAGAFYSMGPDAWSFSARSRYAYSKQIAIFSPSDSEELIRCHTIEPLLRHTSHPEFCFDLSSALTGEVAQARYGRGDFPIAVRFLSAPSVLTLAPRGSTQSWVSSSGRRKRHGGSASLPGSCGFCLSEASYRFAAFQY